MEVQTTKEMVALPLSNKKKHCEVLINAFQLSFSVLQTFSLWILPSWIPKKCYSVSNGKIIHSGKLIIQTLIKQKFFFSFNNCNTYLIPTYSKNIITTT